MASYMGETKTTTTSTTTNNNTPPTPFQRSWLSSKITASEKLGEQLEKAAYQFLDTQKKNRGKKNLKSHTALRYISNFEFLSRHTRTNELEFSIGKSGDRFTIRYKSNWERGEPGQFFITTKATKLKEWADLLNVYNSTTEGGAFAYAFQAMEAILLQAEITYMNLVDQRDTTIFDSPTSSALHRKNMLQGVNGNDFDSLRQPTSDQFKQVWNAHDADTSHASEAKRRIIQEFQKLKEAKLNGIECEYVHSNNPFLWRVYLRNFNGMLGDDLTSRVQIYPNHLPTDANDAIELEIKFPAQYPQDPPFLRIKKPILQEFTGRVSGGALCYPTLMKAGWDSSNRMHRVLVSIKEHLELYEARLIIAASPTCEYPLPTCKASWGYINDRMDRTSNQAPPQQQQQRRGNGGFDPNLRNTNRGSGMNFSKDLIILSSSFVKECILPDSGHRELRGALNEQFEAGNKVLLHHTFFGSLPTEMGSGGLTFQILTAMGLKCYCGILTGLCPEENQLIVPDWMMKSMFVDDGHKVNFSMIQSLERLIGCVLQPIDSNFNTVLKDSGYDSKTWLQNALKNYSAVTRGQTITLGSKNFDFHERPHEFRKYNFILQSIEPDEPGCKMWNDFDFSLNVNFDLPLVDTKGLPRSNSSNSSDSSNGNRGETKNGRGGGGGGYSAAPKRTQKEVEEMFRNEKEKERNQLLLNKEKLEENKCSANYNNDLDAGTKINVWIYRMEGSTQHNRIQIKCKTTTLVHELYAMVENITGIQHQTFHLVDRQERRIPNEVATVTFEQLNMIKKNNKLWMKAPQQSECSIVLGLASKIYRTHQDTLRDMDCSNDVVVRQFLKEMPLLQAMNSNTMQGSTPQDPQQEQDRNMNILNELLKEDNKKNESKYNYGETKNQNQNDSTTTTTTTTATNTTNTNVNELIEYLIPYLQKASNVDVSWAPPGGWICNECDHVNIRPSSSSSSSTFGNETCKRCSNKRTYLQDEIAERDIWELSDFLDQRGVRAPNAFPSIQDYINTIRMMCSDIVSQDEEPMRFDIDVSSDDGVGGGGGQKSERNRISTVLLPSGKSIGMCQPVIGLSAWYFTMKELVGNETELKHIDVNDLVENLGANIL